MTNPSPCAWSGKWPAPTTMLDIVGGLERYCADERLTSLATVCNILGTVPKL